MKLQPEIRSWVYEEQLFNEPYEAFYDLLTTPMERVKGGGKGTKVMRGGMVGSTGDRTATIPLQTRPDQPFSRESEKLEIKRLEEAGVKVRQMREELKKELTENEAELARLKAEG